MIVRALSISFLGLSCAATLCLVFYSTRMLRSPSANAFIFFMTSIFIYTFGYLYELSSDTVETIFLALKIEYLGIPLIAVLWFIFAVEYNEFRVSRRYAYPALFIIPLVTMVMLHTNMHHFLHYKSLNVDTRGPFPVVMAEKGLWYYIDFTYKTFLNLAGTALFGFAAVKATGYRKKQAAMIFCGALIPCVGNILSVLGVAPYGMDITPFLLSIAVPLCSYAMFRLRMFDIVPIARDRIFKTINTSVIVLNKGGRVVDFNDCARSILPRLTDESLGLELRDVLPESGDGENAPARVHNGDREVEFTVEGRKRCFTISTTVLRSRHEENVGLIVSLHDITENKMLLKQMEQIASVDALTQVYARRFLMESFLVEIRRAWRKKGELSFLLVDIDHFKNVNDTYGHLAGDRVLKNTAGAFKNVLRDSDVLGRYGGEEFAIVLPDTNQDGAKALAERLRAEVASTMTVYEETVIETTISIGIATVAFERQPIPADCERMREALLKASDQALYQAKGQGRNQVRMTRLTDGR